MRASEWQYLCAVHDPPKSCCAIDYCCHTLDWAANVLTSQKHFPSRLTLGSDASGGSQQGVKQLTNIFRRVYRIFAHSWFQHRQVFWQVEGNEGLYIFFKTVCDVYNLIPEDNYTIPSEAEGMGMEDDYSADERESRFEATMSGRQSSNLESNSQTASARPSSTLEQTKEAEDARTTVSTGATTRRHKHTPSIGSVVTTIAEADEEPEAETDFDHFSGKPKAAESEVEPKPISRSATTLLRTGGLSEGEAAQSPISKDEAKPPKDIADDEKDTEKENQLENDEQKQDTPELKQHEAKYEAPLEDDSKLEDDSEKQGVDKVTEGTALTAEA